MAIANLQFWLDPFSDKCVFIFCNKRKTSIKVLRYDKNGFILASKKLFEGMKFQWPKNPSEIKEITFQQMEWLAARIGSSVHYCEPFTPTSKSKIERWFLTLRMQYLASLDMRNFHSIEELRSDFSSYIARYNQTVYIFPLNFYIIKTHK